MLSWFCKSFLVSFDAFDLSFLVLVRLIEYIVFTCSRLLKQIQGFVPVDVLKRYFQKRSIGEVSCEF